MAALMSSLNSPCSSFTLIVRYSLVVSYNLIVHHIFLNNTPLKTRGTSLYSVCSNVIM